MKLLYIALLMACLPAKAQNLFPEKFAGCNTDHFALESKVEDAKILPSVLMMIVTQKFGDENLKKISGILKLQIIVDTDGKSCLLSVENGTNVETSQMNLKETIDQNLIWQKPSQKVAALVFLKFEGGKMYMKRMGLDGNLGWHELSKK